MKGESLEVSFQLSAFSCQLSAKPNNRRDRRERREKQEKEKKSLKCLLRVLCGSAVEDFADD
jgi:hypothetical protein